MKRYSDMDELLNHIWEEVEQRAQDPAHPYHTPTFGTVGTNGPSLRTVILRQVDTQERSLIFHSDSRAQKIKEIQNNSRVTWHFWSPDSNEQLRLMGEASLHFDDELANAVWQNSHPKSLKIYVKPIAPNTEVDEPQSGIAAEIESAKLSNRDEVEEGRKYFAVVRTRIDEISFLHLHKEGNYRAHFKWGKNGVSSSWIIP